MKPIYVPKGKAKEYGDYAINIYTGCPHRCYYCFAPNVLRRDKEKFHSCIQPRDGIVEATRTQIERENINNKLIHLCFTCDPYPRGYDSTPTREIIKIIKESGNHVQILTKNGVDASRDFDLLNENDWFGITYAGYARDEFLESPFSEPHADSPYGRLTALLSAHNKGINTWVSAEPVLNAYDVIDCIEFADYVDLWKIGKLNYHPSDIDWKRFGKMAEIALKAKGTQYYIKESLRAEMDGERKEATL